MTDPGHAGALPYEPAEAVLDQDGLESLVRVLRRRGRTVIGPTVRDGAIVLAELESAAELPHGWGVELEAGRYRMRRRADTAAFAHSAGPQSWKSFLHPERVRQWSADLGPDEELTVREDNPEATAYAFLGVRPCDLRAIRILDRVLTGGRHQDPVYGARRTGAFLIAVECTEPGVPRASASPWARGPPSTRGTTSHSPKCWTPTATVCCAAVEVRKAPPCSPNSRNGPPTTRPDAPPRTRSAERPGAWAGACPPWTCAS